MRRPSPPDAPALDGALHRVRRWGALLLLLVVLCACGESGAPPALTFSGSALGAEGEVLVRQVRRFEERNPGLRVRIERAPDDATQRHQLYVQWLNARVGSPDVLQLDVVWTPEFAAAGWILPLDRFAPATDDFFASTLRADRWQGRLYALPWFVDAGILYWRTDLLAAPPQTLEELMTASRRAMAAPGGPPRGIVWQGARYEGLVTVFLEVLGAFGGEILSADHRVVVDSPQGIAALSYLRRQIESGVAPAETLTWHEEETRFAFQNGTSVFLRNWPYAYSLLSQAGESRVAGRVGIAPMPRSAAAPSGRPTAALGGAQLAINAHSLQPEPAYRLIAYLTAPEQMLERAEVVGQYPARRSVYADPRLSAALGIPAREVLRIVEAAAPRPVTPIYTELSAVLQIHLHRALAGETAPAAALRSAAREMEEVITRTGVRQLASRGSGRG